MRLLQLDASLSARELGDRVGLTATSCWRRVRALEKDGVIARWVERFRAGIDAFPEIIEAYRTSGDVDYTLKVMVPSIAEYDEFYKRLIAVVDLYDVRSIFVMEEMKHTTALPLDYIEVG